MKKSTLLLIAVIAVAACSKDKNNDPIQNLKTASDERDLQGKNFVV